MEQQQASEERTSESSCSELVLIPDETCISVDLRVVSGGSCIVAPQADWPDAISYALAVDLQDSVAIFRSSPAYARLPAPLTSDPTHLLYFLSFYPFHVETLQRLSLQYQQEGSVDMAQSTLEHLLYAYQVALRERGVSLSDITVPSTASTFNTLLVDSLLQYAALISQRKAHIRALEVGKLLLRLKPQRNELATVMLVELSAVEAKQWDFLTEFHCNYMQEFHAEGELLWLPSSLYTAALASAMRSESPPQVTEEDVQACEAVQAFPDLLAASPSSLLLVAVAVYPSIAALLLQRRLSAARQVRSDHSPLGNLQELSRRYADMFGRLWQGWPMHWLNSVWVRSLANSQVREQLLSQVKAVFPLSLFPAPRENFSSECAFCCFPSSHS